jgi:hypothetical protein
LTPVDRAWQLDSSLTPVDLTAWCQCLRVKCDEPLSNFAFNFNLRPSAEAGASGAAAGAGASASGFEAVLYSPFKLFPPRRKMSQMVLLQMVARDIKARFNAEFQDMTGTKMTHMDKVGELNQRITEIRGELKAHTTDVAPLFEPQLVGRCRSAPGSWRLLSALEANT